MYEVKYSNQALKFLNKCDKIQQKRILEKIEKLSENPFIKDTKRVEGTDYYRVRVGKNRIMYEVDKKANIIGIVKIDKRPKVYD
ncbi:MAG: type II toxin-antitoxin system RelE/ParE family toxin [archaeon]